jgi:tRNA-2-methylthio-N6-dimethylallyladenosine synthase
VLVSLGEGRKDAATGRVSGRARDGRLVHLHRHGEAINPGDLATTTVTHAAPHHLVADGVPRLLRRARTAGLDGRPSDRRPVSISLSATRPG